MGKKQEQHDALLEAIDGLEAVLVRIAEAIERATEVIEQSAKGDL